MIIINKDLFDRLIADALAQEFSGWDFSYLSGRMVEQRPSWSYRQMVQAQAGEVDALLDMGTGGGEFLSSLQPLPPNTFATEGYPPNVPIAKARLEPLGVQVVPIQSDEELPFADERFDLVINRHESFWPLEIHRILKPGGKFITQQVGGSNNLRLNELIQERVEHEHSDWNLNEAVYWLENAGFQIFDQREEYPETVFTDIGAVVFYLKVISWQIPDFSVAKYFNRLVAIHNLIQQTGHLVVNGHRFYLEVEKN